MIHAICYTLYAIRYMIDATVYTLYCYMSMLSYLSYGHAGVMRFACGFPYVGQFAWQNMLLSTPLLNMFLHIELLGHFACRFT